MRCVYEMFPQRKYQGCFINTRKQTNVGTRRLILHDHSNRAYEHAKKITAHRLMEVTKG